MRNNSVGSAINDRLRRNFANALIRDNLKNAVSDKLSKAVVMKAIGGNLFN